MPFQSATVDLLQWQRVLWVVGVLLVAVGMVVVYRLWWLVVVVLLLLLSLLGLLFATGPLFVFDRHHSLHRPLFKTLMHGGPNPWIPVSATGALRVS